MTRAEDTKYLYSFDDYYDSLRLDYANNPFDTADTLGVIEFKTLQAGEIEIPYSKEMGGTVAQPYPFTGNGFTKATNGEIIPEYILDKPIRITDGAELYQISRDGTKELIAVYEADNMFIRTIE